MHLIPIHRSFGAFLLLLVSAILLSSWNHGSTTRHLAKRQPLTKDVSPVNASSAAGGITTQLLDIHDDQINLTDTHLPHHISKRALTWYDAVCKGRQLWLGKIHRAFDGVSTGARDYGENDINNGWTKLDIFRPFPDGFVEAFEMIGKDVYPDLGEREPTFTEFKGINLEQGKRYIDGAGKPRDAIPLRDNHIAHYECFYIPLWHAIISSDTRSPKYQLRGAGLSKDALEKRVPPLNRLSDVMWTLYKTVAPFPETLRFIGRDKIINDDTRGIMNEAFRRSPSHGPALWPGVTFDIGSEEALALLGTPNGGATAYILADRAASLGKRRLNVRIWVQETNPAAGYQMLWDMAPPFEEEGG
ncbi:MAG: hypothetical protein Q9221_006756 [Calogaya cf. arnoldii]